METKDLEVFIKAVELGSLTKASDEMGYSPSAGSYIIERIEKQLGIKVLKRTHIGVELTEEGALLLPNIQDLLKLHHGILELASDIRSAVSGAITIGCISSVAIQWLPKILEDFNEQYKGIQVTVMEGGYKDVERWIEDGTVDCGFLSFVTRKRFKKWPLKSDPFLVVLPSGHPLCANAKVHPLQLSPYPILIPSEGLDYEVGEILKNTLKNSTAQYARLTDFSILQMIRQNRGISVLPELLLESTNLTGIETRPLATGEKRTICLAIDQGLGRSSSDPRHSATQRFINFVSSWVKSDD